MFLTFHHTSVEPRPLNSLHARLSLRFVLSADLFLKLTFSKTFLKALSDFPDQAYVISALSGPNCKPRSAADNKICC